MPRRPTVPMPPVSITTDFAQTFVVSPVKAEALAVSLLTSSRPPKERLRASGELVHWASASGNTQHRRAVVSSFHKSNADLALVHHLATLPREQAAVFMKDYLAGGGSMEAVTQWLAIAGARLRAMKRPRPIPRPPFLRARGFGDWISSVGEAIADTADAVGDRVDSVVDAVVDAGKSIGEAIETAAKWTVEETASLVASLIRAGKSAAEILAAAASKGMLDQYVDALLRAGGTIEDVLAWAWRQTPDWAKTALAKIVALGRPLAEILQEAAELGADALLAIVKSLFAIGKSVQELLAAIAGRGRWLVNAVVRAVLAAGQTVRTVVSEAAKLGLAACTAIIGALLDLGTAVSSILHAAGAAMRAIVEALLALGRTVTQILVAAASLTASTVRSTVQALLALGKTIAEIVNAAAGQALIVVKAVFTAIVAVGSTVGDILSALAGRAVSALRTALEALLAMGVSLATLVKGIVERVAEAFRRGFFEGLLALGKGAVELLRAAAEAGVSILLLAFAVLLEIFGTYGPLSAKQREEATRVFGTSIDLDRVKIGFLDLPPDLIRYLNIEIPRPFTTMYLLNFGPGSEQKKDQMWTIIHELMHVWQGVQEGPLYMTRALEAQLTAGIDGLFHKGKYDDDAAYRVTEDELKKHDGDLKKFNPEQQAKIIEYFWLRKFGPRPVASGVPSLEALLKYAQKVNPSLIPPIVIPPLVPTGPKGGGGILTPLGTP